MWRVPLHHAVLALLVQGPGHGYDLKGEFESLVGPHFGTLNIGHLYQLLERLARDGLAETHREPQEARPDRLVYTLTDAGRTELASWFDAPVKITSGYRDDFFLKLAAARSLGDAGLIRRIVDARRAALLQELRDLAALGAEPAASTYDGLLTQAAEIQTRGLLQLLDQVDAAAEALVAEAAGAARVRASDASGRRRRSAS